MYVTSTPFATLVFNESFEIIDRAEFPGKELSSINRLLAEGKWIRYEESFCDKYNAKYLGYKDSDSLMDKGLLEKAARKLRPFFPEFAAANVFLTKESVRDSVNPDSLIVQVVKTVEDSQKVINRLSSRVRDWYALHNPELVHGIQDNEEFVRAVMSSPEPDLEGMGAGLSGSDLHAIISLARQIQGIIETTNAHLGYLDSLMKQRCPNLQALAGTFLGARLLEHAGSLEKLSVKPASAIQTIGAEKAMFRHLKNRKSRPPKHGIIISHPLVANAHYDKKGKAARLLADKIAIAVKVDRFKGKFIGDKLLGEIEGKLK